MSETREERWKVRDGRVYRAGFSVSAFRCADDENAAYAARLLQTRDEHVDELFSNIRALEQERDELRKAIRKHGKCFHCQGTGKPNCVTCDDYQACRCRPGEGRYAESCWNCKGTGVNKWAAEALKADSLIQEGK